MASCGGGDGEPAPTPSAEQSITVTSEAFQEGNNFRADHSCLFTQPIAPDLAWTGVPRGTQSLVVLAVDPDADNFVHWLVYGIPPEMASTSTPGFADGSRQGKNSFGKIGYGPLCPPEGSTHTYQFYVYALDTDVVRAAGASRAEIAQDMQGHILAWGVLTGTFGR